MDLAAVSLPRYTLLSGCNVIYFLITQFRDAFGATDNGNLLFYRLAPRRCVPVLSLIEGISWVLLGSVA
jgi:hypothetical protein